MEPMQLLIMSSCSDCSTDCFLHVDCRRSESQKALPSSGGGELGAPHQASATASTLKRTCWQCSLLRVNIGAADKNCLNNVADEVASLILWKPRWECADNFAHSSNTAQARMAQAYEQAKASQPALKLAATTSRQQHTGKTNLDRQGQLVSDELKPERTLWCQPGLKRLIHIDPEDTGNPDQDIVSTGRYTTGMTSQSQVAPPVSPLVKVYSDDLANWWAQSPLGG